MEAFPCAHIYSACKFADHAQFFGDDLVLLKSPLSGMLFIKIVERHEPLSTTYQFSPIKTVNFCQGLFELANFVKSQMQLVEITNVGGKQAKDPEQLHVFCGQRVEG